MLSWSFFLMPLKRWIRCWIFFLNPTSWWLYTLHGTFYCNCFHQVFISTPLSSPVPSLCLSFSTTFSPFSHSFLCPSLPCRRYDIHPVCADLQGQILSCYKENVGKTLNCSNIAALYLQCVNNVKQVGADHFHMHTYIHSHYCDEH